MPVKRDCQARRRVISATGRAGSVTTITTDYPEHGCAWWSRLLVVVVIQPALAVSPATKGAGGGRNDTYDAGERYPVPMDIITAQVSTSVFLSRRSRGQRAQRFQGPQRVAR